MPGCGRGRSLRWEDGRRSSRSAGRRGDSGQALRLELLGGNAQDDDVDPPVQTPTVTSSVRRYGAVLSVPDRGQAHRGNPSALNQVPEHVGRPRSGQLPIRRKLRGLDRDVVGMTFDAHIVPGRRHRRRCLRRPGRRIKEHRLHGRFDQDDPNQPGHVDQGPPGPNRGAAASSGVAAAGVTEDVRSRRPGDVPAYEPGQRSGFDRLFLLKRSNKPRGTYELPEL